MATNHSGTQSCSSGHVIRISERGDVCVSLMIACALIHPSVDVRAHTVLEVLGLLTFFQCQPCTTPRKPGS